MTWKNIIWTQKINKDFYHKVLFIVFNGMTLIILYWTVFC